MCSVVPATFSEGLRTKVFPAVGATGIIQRGIIVEKLKVEIKAQIHKRTR